MREIKFRAWNVDVEKMVYSNEDDSADYWDGVNISEVDMVNARLRYYKSLNNTYEWMQFTGWVDGASNEWYEGDICEIRDENDTSWFEIVFQNGAFRMKFPEWDNVLMEYNIITLLHAKMYIRIGNRFENPELLGRDDD